MKISDFSKISGLTIDALYHYDEINLLKPERVDEFSGYRYYSQAQLLRANKIMALKDGGFSLKEIASVLEKEEPAAGLIKTLEHKAAELDMIIEKETDRLERLRTNIFLIKNGGIPYMGDISIKRTEAILVASLRRSFKKEEFDENLEEMWPLVNDYIISKGARLTTPCMMLYHSGWWDMKEQGICFNPQTLDVEVAEPLLLPCEGGAGIRVYELPSVSKMACIVHIGPFSTMGETINRLLEWLKANGYKASGPMREIYHKGQWATENENEYITEVQIPLE